MAGRHLDYVGESSLNNTTVKLVWHKAEELNAGPNQILVWKFPLPAFFLP